MLDVASSAGLEGSLTWLCEYVKTGIMPTRGLIPDDSVTEKERGWGTVELVGAKNRTCHIPFTRPVEGLSFEEFFGLPKELENERVERVQRLETARENMHLSPHVYYSSKSANRSANCANLVQNTKKKSQKKLVTEQSERKNQSTLSESEADMDDDELKTRDRSHVRKSREVSQQDDSEASDYPQLRKEDDWRVDFSKCVQGCFAAVQSLYGDKHGLSIMRVNTFFVYFHHLHYQIHKLVHMHANLCICTQVYVLCVLYKWRSNMS